MYHLVSLLVFASLGHSARILGVFPIPSFSHQIVYLPIMKELALRGHEVVVITTDPIKESITNLKQIDVHDVYKFKNNFTKVINEDSRNPINLIRRFVQLLSEIHVQELEHPEVQQLINDKDEHFDLLMIEYMMPTFIALKHRFNCPMIGLTSLDARPMGHHAIGNPVHAVLYPDISMPFKTKELNFFERLQSFSFMVVFKTLLDFYLIPIEDATIVRYFGKGYPSLSDLMNSVDMLFINVNHIFHNIRPLTPATIPIGPYIHMQPPQDLPDDLKLFLDEANDGVIYFSLGSNIKSKDIPVETREVILKTFAELPYKVLWKFEAEDLPAKPENVKIVEWLPQQDILRHKNIKLFITQCGLQSLEESLYSRVPVIGLPFFSDQFSNGVKVESKGLGLVLDHKLLTVEGFRAAINSVISNPKYKERVVELSELIADEPMTSLERAIWWTEYVLRNKGAQHLKGPAVRIPTYQYYYLDIIAFLSATVLLIISFSYLIVKKCLKMCFRKSKQE